MNTPSKYILLVEDNPYDVELIRKELKRNNFTGEVRVSRDGAEALDFLFQKGIHQSRCPSNPEFIILDLRMPKVSGIEVIRQVKNDSRLAAIPIIAFSAIENEAEKKECYALGVSTFIDKSLESEKFRENIKKISSFLAATGDAHQNRLNTTKPGNLNQL